MVKGAGHPGSRFFSRHQMTRDSSGGLALQPKMLLVGRQAKDVKRYLRISIKRALQ
jgi:hypothetical protein